MSATGVLIVSAWIIVTLILYSGYVVHHLKREMRIRMAASYDLGFESALDLKRCAYTDAAAREIKIRCVHDHLRMHETIAGLRKI